MAVFNQPGFVPEEDEEDLPVDLLQINVQVKWLEGEKDKSICH